MTLPRYVHTSLVARDWRTLARFYEAVFGCEPVPPERDQQGQWLDRGTGVPGLRIRGVHLRLPGFGDDGPTLEVFSYSPILDAPSPAPNRPGLGHIAFAVDDVSRTAKQVVAQGGSMIGEPVTTDVERAGTISFVYVRDPEGNVIELQRWT
jgi:catechol 2,3-dioxygenase-like lactoylglutathione lyase family enzyme